MSNEVYLMDFLRDFDERTREDRALRMDFIIKAYGEERQLLIPEMTLHFFEDIKICYINGAFIASFITTLSAIEDLLKHFYRYLPGDRKILKKGLAELTDKAFEDGYISKNDAELIHGLRRIRKFYVHSKEPDYKESLFERVVASGFSVNKFELMREDAEVAISLFFDFLSRYPFTPGFTK